MAETPGRILSPEELAPHLLQLRETVVHALRAYVSIGDGQFGIDYEAASKLGHKPGKGYSAKGEGDFTIGKEVVGKAHVLVFQQGDATGSPGPYNFISNSIAHDLPQEETLFPRRKNNTSTEVVLPLAAKPTDSIDNPPNLYDVTLDLLGFLPRRPETVRRIGELGVDQVRPNSDELGFVTPQAYYTVEPRLGEEEARRGYRLGDPHTIFSGREGLAQVAAFVALDHETAARHSDVFAGLAPFMPRRVPLPMTDRRPTIWTPDS